MTQLIVSRSLAGSVGLADAIRMLAAAGHTVRPVVYDPNAYFLDNQIVPPETLVERAVVLGSLPGRRVVRRTSGP